MTAICESAIHLCRIRVTRLDQVGNPLAGPNNVIVSDTPLMLTVKPQIVAGEDKDLIGGCDCIVSTYRGYDKLKRFDLELDLAQLPPTVLEMMTGGTAIVSAGSVVGLWWPSNLSCSDPAQPNVAFEAWQDAWEEDHQFATDPYIHWLWPSTHWQIGDHTLQNDFLQPKLNGFSRSNPVWGDGIYGDMPEAIPSGAPGGFWYTAIAPPTAYCDYQTHGIT